MTATIAPARRRLPGAVAPRQGAPTSRDVFLDTVRAVAVIRVVTWHTYGWAPITWVVSAVPAMIFVSGHLFARSAERRPAHAVVRDRLRRLLLPFWVFAAAAWAVMIGARIVEGTPETALPLRRVPLWIFPLNDPRGSAWEAGWLTQPLWYLRVLLWLLLCAPALQWLVRRAPYATLATLIAATIGLEAVERSVGWHPNWAPDLVWKIGDFTLYAVFFAFGIAHHHGLVSLQVRHWTLAAFLATTGVVWAVLFPPQDWVVNNSHVVHLFIGGAWLAAAFAIRAPLSALASRGLVHRAVRGIGRRSLTIYLWHSGCVILVWHLLTHFAPLPLGVESAALGLGTVLVTASAVRLFGGLEDLAAGRAVHSPTGWAQATGRWLVPALGVGIIAVWAVYTLPLDSTASVAVPDAPHTEAFAAAVSPTTPATTAKPTAPRVPSQAPRRPVFDAPASTVSSAPRTVVVPVKPVTTTPTETSGPPKEAWTPEATGVDPALAQQLQAAIEEWQGYWGIPGIRIALARPEVFHWEQAFGVDWDGRALQVDTPFDIESITKTFTGALTWQLWQEGKLDLDAPIDHLDGVPEFPAGRFTVRELLNHRSGLPDYHNTVAYAPDDLPPIERAITSALRAPNLGEPDSWQFYSSTNYLILGRYLETITGAALDELMKSRLTDPFGIAPRFDRAPSTNEAPGGGAAGVVGNLDALLVWGDTLLRRHVPLNPDSWTQMSTLAVSTSLGAGVYGYCPCSYDDNGRPTWERIGHSGGTTSLQYDSTYDLLIAYQVPTGVWDANTTPLEDLAEQLTKIIAEFEFK